MEDIWSHYRWLLLASIVPCSVSLVALGGYGLVDQSTELTPYGVIVGLCLTLLFSHWLVWHRLIVPTSKQLHASLIALQKLRDMETELARQQDALYQAEKMSALGSLLAGVAHELNNPLSVVVGRAIMLEAEVTSPQIANGIHKIRDAAERCARVVKTFIAMAKQSDSEPDWVQCNEVIKSATEVTDQGLRNHDIELALELAPDLPAMWADGAQLSQVMMNLIVNAQQALEEIDGPRKLAIKTHFVQDSSTIQIEIKDNGAGIAKELHSRIFEPFFSTKGTGVGMGVGLSVSFSIIQSHRGNITLLDDNVESGAHFVIHLPISPIMRS